MAATVWKGHLSFGLVSIPVKLHRAARAEKVSFRQIYRVGRESSQELAPPPEPEQPEEREEQARVSAPSAAAAKRQGPAPAIPIRAAAEPEPATPQPAPEPPVARARQSTVTQSGEQPVQRENLLKGYEYEKDRYVVVDKEELKQLAPKASRVMEIREFVRLAEIDPIYFESSYYVSPEPSGTKPYALLYEALKRTGYVALAELVMHNRQHVVVVRPGRTGIILHTMFYEDEIHRDEEYRADLDVVGQKELELATMLVESLAAPFDPQKYRDTYRESVEALIASKISGKAVAETAPPQPERGHVVDIMDALQKSLALARKPAEKATERTGVKSEEKPKPQKRAKRG